MKVIAVRAGHPVVLSRPMLVTVRAILQLRTGPHGGRLSQSKLVTQWCYHSKGNASHRSGVITAQDWSSRVKVITVQAGRPVVLPRQDRSPEGLYHSSGLVLTGEGYHSPSWSPSGVIPAAAGHRWGVITAQDWSSRGKVITVRAGHPVVLTQHGNAGHR